MTAPETIRAAVVAALVDESGRCLDSDEDREAVAREVTRHVIAVLPDEPRERGHKESNDA